MNATAALQEEGQSLWLDYIRRSLLTGGQLQRLIDEDGLRGMTSNPSIFQEAIGETAEYDGDLKALVEARPDAGAPDLYETIAVEEIRRACDLLRPVFDETGTDGLVSLEVSPHLARDTDGTIAEARRLWNAVDRPNLMIKVPATEEGIPAVEQLISEGINVNITLMFSLDHYEATAEAYIRGLERRVQSGADPTGIHSVASFFVSRVARMADAALDEAGADPGFHGGDVAIANAKMAYQRFKEIFHGERFAELKKQGALVQRPLWASTSTKNPDYSDVLYVEELIGPETVNTMPPHTLDAFRHHGAVRGATIEGDLERARKILGRLPELGIDLDEITEDLQERGIEKFSDPFDALLDAIEEKRQVLSQEAPPATFALGALGGDVNNRLAQWETGDFASRLWERDPTLWADPGTPELTDRLGWLGLPMAMDAEAGALMRFAQEVKDDFDDVVVCGMGGSSLAPEVFGDIFGDMDESKAGGYPRLTALDSTHPDAVSALEERLDLERTLFVIASKSGTTTETLSFFRYFWGQLEKHTDAPGQHVLAVTDPGSPLAELGAERGFRKVFTTTPDVGGRYSAFTHFGLVPAALAGVDLHALLARARRMAESAGAERPAPANDGLRLGAVLGEAARAGRDKVTFSTSPALAAFPAWLEQLIAESTGKDGQGLVPVAGEPLGAPDVYGRDRLFVHFQLEGDMEGGRLGKLSVLEDAGHPVVRIRLTDRADLAREMFRWEVAVAAAGAALGIHPFNQPNVEAAKRLAKEAMQQDSTDGAASLDETSAADRTALADALKRWLRDGEAGDYFSIQAYLAPSGETTDALMTLARQLRNGTTRAATLGYGPRFLHSTGQLHKGGPNTVQVLQLVNAPQGDAAVPETDFSFGELIHAQSVGDYRALREADRRVLRVRLDDAASGLEAMLDVVEEVTAKAAA